LKQSSLAFLTLLSNLNKWKIVSNFEDLIFEHYIPYVYYDMPIFVVFSQYLNFTSSIFRYIFYCRLVALCLSYICICRHKEVKRIYFIFNCLTYNFDVKDSFKLTRLPGWYCKMDNVFYYFPNNPSQDLRSL